MSEEKPKQYLLMVNEENMNVLAKMMPSLLFVQTMGMNIKDNEENMFLVTPKPKVDNGVNTDSV